MVDAISALVGLITGALMIGIGRKFRLEGWFYATSLASLPLIYVAFGYPVPGGNVMLLEFLYGIPFYLICIWMLCTRNLFSYYLAGFGWILHGIYDLSHDFFFVNPGVWFWYPIFCAAVDLLVGGYLLYAARRLQGTSLGRSQTVQHT